MSFISGVFQSAVYILRAQSVASVFSAGHEFCYQSGIYNGLMMKQLF